MVQKYLTDRSAVHLHANDTVCDLLSLVALGLSRAAEFRSVSAHNRHAVRVNHRVEGVSEIVVITQTLLFVILHVLPLLALLLQVQPLETQHDITLLAG